MTVTTTIAADHRGRAVDSHRRAERGDALIEFAVVLPVLLLLLAGVTDVGRVYSSAVVVSNAARQAARYAATSPADTTTIKARASEEAGSSGVTIDPNKITILTPSGTASGNPITVQVGLSVPTLLPGVLGLSTINVTRQCTMVIF